MRKEQPVRTLTDAMKAYSRGPEAVAAAVAELNDYEAKQRASQLANISPARKQEIEREREAAAQARKPELLKPGTKIKVHITGWQYDDQPSEVVEDRGDKGIVAKRLRRNGDEEIVTVKFTSISLWRHQ